MLIDSRAGSNLLYLPLERLLQGGGAAQAPAAAAAAPEPVVPAAPSTDMRSRDGGRSRDREGR
jgi:membrane protease subunit HflK